MLRTCVAIHLSSEFIGKWPICFSSYLFEYLLSLVSTNLSSNCSNMFSEMFLM